MEGQANLGLLLFFFDCTSNVDSQIIFMKSSVEI
jgi:hypothetical protein